jgi:hypothetical protein
LFFHDTYFEGEELRSGDEKDLIVCEVKKKYIHSFAVETDRKRPLGRPRL